MPQDVLPSGVHLRRQCRIARDEKGRGPAWANSLFEDNAEFGYGMVLATKQMREKIEQNMKRLLELDIDDTLRKALNDWLEYKDKGEASRRVSDKVIEAVEHLRSKDPVIVQLCDRIVQDQDYLVKKIHLGSRRRRMGL